MNIFSKILGLAGGVHELVNLADQVIPGPKQGASKLDFVLQIALAGYNADPELPNQIASKDFVGIVSGIAAIIVAAMKAAAAAKAAKVQPTP
jgi:hypothetical protein